MTKRTRKTPSYFAGTNPGIFSKAYWRDAASVLGSPRMLAFAGIITALRILVKMFEIPLAANLKLAFDCYVNVVGSVVYGPVAGLLVGAVSDTLGALLFPSGAYFFPYIFPEMLSGFIFGLYLWRRKLTVGRAVLGRFSVNVFCNMFLTSVITKWYLIFLGSKSAAAYSVLDTTRIIKNLVLFPVESALIALLLAAVVPLFRHLGLVAPEVTAQRFEKKHWVLIAVLAVLSVLLAFLYMRFVRK